MKNKERHKVWEAQELVKDQRLIRIFITQGKEPFSEGFKEVSWSQYFSNLRIGIVLYLSFKLYLASGNENCK